MAVRIQDEIAALDWVTSPQKVTTMEPTNHTVSGWCSGILVQFQIRSGRVRGWSQRACSLPSAARALAATPHAWGNFMQRTAELAATMTQPASLQQELQAQRARVTVVTDVDRRSVHRAARTGP